jgi:cytoskeletal protein CcmA (bactofilin family)
MFTKKPDGVSALDAARSNSSMPPPLNGAAAPVATSRSYAAPTGAVSSSVIGTDLTVLGNLQSKGEIQIEGVVQGDIQAARVIVGQAARITGGVVADDVVVQGTVMGSIRGNRVTLQSSSKVEGDVFHQSLAIEQGAFFEGKSRRSDDPTAVTKAGGEVSNIFGTSGPGSTG